MNKKVDKLCFFRQNLLFLIIKAKYVSHEKKKIF